MKETGRTIAWIGGIVAGWSTTRPLWQWIAITMVGWLVFVLGCHMMGADE